MMAIRQIFGPDSDSYKNSSKKRRRIPDSILDGFRIRIPDSDSEFGFRILAILCTIFIFSSMTRTRQANIYFNASICQKRLLALQFHWIEPQGSKGIREWPINWRTSPLMIHKITPFANYNWWLKRLDTQIN